MGWAIFLLYFLKTREWAGKWAKFFHSLGNTRIQKLLQAKRVTHPFMSKISLIPPKMICHTTRISIHNWLWLNFGRKIMDDSSSPRFIGGKNDWMISSSIGVWILSLRYQGGERRRRYKLKTQCTLGLVKLTAYDFREWFLIFASLTEIELIICNANHSTQCEWAKS